jgi:hypothetical protein
MNPTPVSPHSRLDAFAAWRTRFPDAHLVREATSAEYGCPQQSCESLSGRLRSQMTIPREVSLSHFKVWALQIRAENLKSPHMRIRSVQGSLANRTPLLLDYGAGRSYFFVGTYDIFYSPIETTSPSCLTAYMWLAAQGSPPHLRPSWGHDRISYSPSPIVTARIAIGMSPRDA